MENSGKDIRHIATSHDGPIVAVAEFEKHVQIWNVQTRLPVFAFETTMDIGGDRLAITPDGKRCIAGAYHVHGIAAYDTTTGRELWRRSDLKKVQQIQVSVDGKHAFCGFERTIFTAIDVETGETAATLQGTDGFHQSIYDDVAIIERNGGHFEVVDKAMNPIATIPTLDALDLAFAPSQVCVSVGGAAISCYDTMSGRRMWRHKPDNGVHAICLSYNESQRVFVAILWPYKEGGAHRLIALGGSDGRVLQTTDLTGATEFGFCISGSVLIASDGRLFNSATGDVEGKLSF